MSADENQPLLIEKIMDQMEREQKRRRPYWIRFVVLILFNIPYTAAFSIAYQFCYGVIADKYGLSFDPSDNETDSNVTYCGQNINETQSDLQAQVDSETSNWLLYYGLASGIPAILTTIVFGSLSDYVGRKFMFLTCNIGVLIKCAVLVAMVKMNLDLSWGYLGFVLEGVSGSGFVLLLASFAYTADVTSVGAKRQFGVALMEGLNTVAGGAASFAIGYIIEDVGFLVPSIICCCILLINIFIIVVFLPETVDTDDGSVKRIPDGIKNMVNLYVKDNGKRRRGKLLLLLLVFAIFLHSLLGTTGVSTIYQLSEPYCFSSSDLGIYGAVSSIATNFIGIPLIKVYQKVMTPPMISVLGTIFDFTANLLSAFAVNKLMMFFGKFVLKKIPLNYRTIT